jgi:hypothetical protein
MRIDGGACQRGAAKASLAAARTCFLAVALAGCGSSALDHADGSSAGGAGSTATAGGAGGMGGALPAGTNTCPSIDNPPGSKVLDIPWPIANGVANDGYDLLEGDSALVSWSGGPTQNVFQIALWTSPETDPGWQNELSSGPRAASGMLAWNTGTFPCGYRPGLYFLADGDPQGIAAAVSLTVDPTMGGSHYAAKPCSMLADTSVYEGRYAKYAGRVGCTQYEVNNFMTETHYDWLSGTGTTFDLTQGDLLLFRWSDEHNVVQAHDQSQDQPVPGGIVSGNRTSCVPGPNYTCVNGSLDLGEYMIDTTDHRPGYIHLTDQCTYGCATCPEDVACDDISPNTTGTTFEVLLQRPVRPAPPTPGACCGIQGYKAKGQACRVVDVYNDNDGTQFDTGLGGGLTVNRGDLVRFRWAGAVRIVQVEGGKDGTPSTTPMPMGAAMPASVDCVPGPGWTCLLGMTDQAEFIVDVDAAVTAGHFETFSSTGMYLNFYAFADNSHDPFNTTHDSAILLPIADASPYANNPPCP